LLLIRKTTALKLFTGYKIMGGFNAGYSNKLFTAFEQLHSNKEFEEIGLALVKRIIEKHKSELNYGATFYFSLP